MARLKVTASVALNFKIGNTICWLSDYSCLIVVKYIAVALTLSFGFFSTVLFTYWES